MMSGAMMSGAILSGLPCLTDAMMKVLREKGLIKTT